MNTADRSKLHFVVVLVLISGIYAVPTLGQWTQTGVRGPTGSNAFGAQVVGLSNGNYFVSDPAFDPGSGPGTGAVFLYDGATNKVISQVIGSRAGDQVGSGGIYEIGFDRIVISSPEWNGTAGAATWMENRAGVNLKVDQKNSLVGRYAGSRVSEYGVILLFNRNFVVISPSWTDGTRTNLGAVTWGANLGPLAGYVSSKNSLVGSTSGDHVGSGAVSGLRNGNYVVRTPTWTNRGAASAGAATWGNGTTGTVGVVSASNSIVGTQAGDRVGQSVVGLANSNYVVASSQWANRAAVRAGAVTVGNGLGGTVGAVSPNNSLVGGTADDQVGYRVTGLPSGDFVVLSPFWDDPATGYTDVGAATWGKSTGVIIGSVNVNNSRLGSDTNDRVGSGSIVTLSNGNYVFTSPFWNKERGAVTWGDAGGGTSYGYVSDKNSMAGANSKDHAGSGGVFALAGGNYAFASPDWDFGVFSSDVGAVTWGDGTNGSVGLVDASNSLFGSTPGDKVGSRGIVPMLSGNYVALSPSWSWNGQTAVGAATFVPGGGPFSDVVSAGNSIHGDKSGDRVANGGGTAVDQNYAIFSQFWGSAGIDNDGLGAVTWGDGINGTTGPVSGANSLVGGSRGDRIGMSNRVNSPLASGNGGLATKLFDRSIVIASTFWGSNGVNADGIGAITWFDSAVPTTGVVDAGNSIVGSTRGDLIGSCGPACGSVYALQNNGYLIYSNRWDNGSIVDAGAVTLAAPRGSIVGPITYGNSVIGRVAGTAQNGGVLVPYSWLTPSSRLLVGLPFENSVVSIGP